ncbi:hypothetical protein CQ14_30970 [Bradyrhizobium lablabi]|uniref:Uncharacterized protein n=1 Tax=Bradyrhizobium lablabi TaxID=722472 RepID=A0A0R3MR00_9BRAD|nr:hypothetical protein [Bradyrhizobium lablabi]KRR22632.1 hypothetical protein CQ14_30970 [Bradyrhizobium lablabi]
MNEEVYANGRTYAEHCAWLGSLTGNEYRIVHMPIGHLMSMAYVSYFKYALLNCEMTAAERLRLLDGIAKCVHGPITSEAIEVIDPACATALQILKEINSVGRERACQAFHNGDCFRILARLNPSLLRALELCRLGPVPERPQTAAS